MVDTVETVCNKALRRIGSPLVIGSIFEGSSVARVALDNYGETRDALLKQEDWDFAERNVTATQSGSSPPPGWAYAITYPSDCLKVRYVLPATVPTPNNDPRPTLFDDVNVAGSSSTRIIVSNTFPATVRYTGQILDISQWDVGFTDALVAALAVRFALALGQGDMVKVEAALADQAMQELGASQSSVPPAFQAQRGNDR